MAAKTEQSMHVFLEIGPDEIVTAAVVHPALPGWEATIRLSNGSVDAFGLRPGGVRPRRPGSEPADHPLPPGGVTTTLLRRVPLAEMVREVRRRIAESAKRSQQRADRFDELWFAQEHPELRTTFREMAARGRRLSERPGRAGRSETEYAEIAAVYVRLVDTERTPVATLAKQLHLSPSQVRNVLYAARRRGLLTDAEVKGRPGGRLTPKAIALLKGDNDGQR